MTNTTELLIIGAGPFGLSLGAFAGDHGIDYVMVGEPMAFWRGNMPAGMHLRSTCDWHLDPAGIDTIDAFLDAIDGRCANEEPLSLAFYLSYADWFMRRNVIRPRASMVVRLDRRDDVFVATLDDGDEIRARNVAVLVGQRSFAHAPIDVTSLLPSSSWGHTCDVVDLDALGGRRVVIVGGRQSAFEWTALLREAGAAAIDVCYRHDTPSFETSDWSWVTPLVERGYEDGGWFRRLPAEEQQAITHRMWHEGRAKLEPWLAPRIAHDTVCLRPRTRITGCIRTDAGELRVRLDSHHVITADTIILATGYRADLKRVPFLRDGNVWDEIDVVDGHPCLDEDHQTTRRGLYISGLPAARDFGPFFGFTIAARVSAARIGRAILRGSGARSARLNS